MQYFFTEIFSFAFSCIVFVYAEDTERPKSPGMGTPSSKATPAVLHQGVVTSTMFNMPASPSSGEFRWLAADSYSFHSC